MKEISSHQTNVLYIEGGQPIEGTVFVRGAKNTVPKNMVAALLTGDICVVKDIARIVDVDIMRSMIEAFGGKAKFVRNHSIQIDASSLRQISPEQMSDFAGKSRIPILTCGPLLARTGCAIVPALGG